VVYTVWFPLPVPRDGGLASSADGWDLTAVVLCGYSGTLYPVWVSRPIICTDAISPRQRGGAAWREM
jgi:hypothetical protein